MSISQDINPKEKIDQCGSGAPNGDRIGLLHERAAISVAKVCYEPASRNLSLVLFTEKCG